MRGLMKLKQTSWQRRTRAAQKFAGVVLSGVFALILLQAHSQALVASKRHPAIVVAPNVELEDLSEINLSDIVRTVGFEPSVAEMMTARFKSVRIGGSRKSGSDSEGMVLTRLAIEQALKESVGELLAPDSEIEMHIPSRVQVILKVRSWSVASVDSEIKTEVAARCPDCRVELRNIKIPKVDSQMMRSWQIAIGDEIPKGIFSVPVYFVDAKAQKQSLWISGEARLFRKVLVAKVSKSAGDMIREDEISAVERDVTHISDGFVQNKDLLTSVASRTISSEQILTRSLIKKDWAVKSGDPIRLMSVGEGFAIGVDGISQSHGYIGDTVRVKIPRTQKQISAVVNAKGSAEVSR
jgi:flagella basal body P-ring formation protein FlgA